MIPLNPPTNIPLALPALISSPSAFVILFHHPIIIISSHLHSIPPPSVLPIPSASSYYVISSPFSLVIPFHPLMLVIPCPLSFFPSAYPHYIFSTIPSAYFHSISSRPSIRICHSIPPAHYHYHLFHLSALVILSHLLILIMLSLLHSLSSSHFCRLFLLSLIHSISSFYSIRLL
jgi:hypothetical protein